MPKHCPFCNADYPHAAPVCLVCARPSVYPNRVLAQDAQEVRGVELYYRRAYNHARRRGAEDRLRQFEDVARKSELVTACRIWRLNTFVEADDGLYPVYQNLVRAGIVYPGDDPMDHDRLTAEEATLPGFSHEIRFAALTINEAGILNYGNYFLFWDLDKTAHRTSVFVSNCVTWRQKIGISLSETDLPHGIRAIWEDRHLLAVAKCGEKITSSTHDSEFGNILMLGVPGNPYDDEFIEAHIWGPMTRRTLRKVIKAEPDMPVVPADPVEEVYLTCMGARIERNLRSIGVPLEIL